MFTLLLLSVYAFICLWGTVRLFFTSSLPSDCCLILKRKCYCRATVCTYMVINFCFLEHVGMSYYARHFFFFWHFLVCLHSTSEPLHSYLSRICRTNKFTPTDSLEFNKNNNKFYGAIIYFKKYLILTIFCDCWSDSLLILVFKWSDWLT